VGDASGTSEKAAAASPAATPAEISASRTPPSDTSAGSATDPIVPPSGTASWRHPIAIPRSAGENSRSSEVMPATGTAAPPAPATSRPAANAQGECERPAATSPIQLIAPPASSTRRPPSRSTSIPAGISMAADPSPGAAYTAPNPAGPTCSAERTSSAIAGRPKLIVAIAAWEMIASARIVRRRDIAGRLPGRRRRDQHLATVFG